MYANEISYYTSRCHDVLQWSCTSSYEGYIVHALQWIISNHNMLSRNAPYSRNVRNSNLEEPKCEKRLICWSMSVYESSIWKRFKCSPKTVFASGSVKETTNCWKSLSQSQGLTHSFENVLLCPIRLCSSKQASGLSFGQPRHTRVCTRSSRSRR